MLEVIKFLKNANNIIVLNKSLSFGSSGTITQEIKDSFYYSNKRPKIYDVIISLGGKDVFVEDIINLAKNTDKLPSDKIIWRE